MTEMQAFYDVAFPKLNDVIEYCDKFPVDDLPEDARTLMHLMQSLILISFPIEAWKQPRVPDSGAACSGCDAPISGAASVVGLIGRIGRLSARIAPRCCSVSFSRRACSAA